MRQSHPGSFRQLATFLRRQFFQDGALPFADVLRVTCGGRLGGVWATSEAPSRDAHRQRSG